VTRSVGTAGHLHYFTLGSLARLFEGYGFVRRKVAGGGVFGEWRSVWPSLLTGDVIVQFEKQ
jgi:hypothetical protein